MKENNPFTLIFGKEPASSIPRDDILSEIVMDFSRPNPTTQVYIITGARGSGKTVLLSELYQYFDQQNDWISVDVNPHRNILEDLASSLYDKGAMRHLFLKGSFDISFHGVSFSLEGSRPVTSIASVVDGMLAYLKGHNKKLFVSLDEVTTTEKVKEFVHDFQSYIRKDYPIYLVMTGLYENVAGLQDNKSLTFLYRAPKILLAPLDDITIMRSYMEILEINEDTAKRLTRLVKGYGFGYQALGYLFYERRVIDDELIEKYDEALRINAYNKIWEGLGENEKRIVLSFHGADESKVSEILTETTLNNKTFSVYRDRLIKKGVAAGKERGILSIILPRFSVYASQKREIEQE